jgi:hypothetical protein
MLMNKNTSSKSYAEEILGMIIDFILPLMKLNKFKFHEVILMQMENIDAS